MDILNSLGSQSSQLVRFGFSERLSLKKSRECEDDF